MLDVYYPKFNKGDEVTLIKQGRYKAITYDKPYIVLDCYTPPGFIEGYKGLVIELKTDNGSISRYASYRFKPTKKQIRINKLRNII